jgi:hypothetical protein
MYVSRLHLPTFGNEYLMGTWTIIGVYWRPLNFIHNILSFEHSAKYNMLPIQVVQFIAANEKLASICIRARVGHRNRIFFIYSQHSANKVSEASEESSEKGETRRIKQRDFGPASTWLGSLWPLPPYECSFSGRSPSPESLRSDLRCLVCSERRQPRIKYEHQSVFSS